MTIDVTVVLDRLHCVRESDGNGHSEPYIWPTLLWIDNATLNTPELVGVTAPPDRFARVQVRGDMQAGETAEIPASVRELTARVDEAGFRALILVVALWEHDETPRAAVVAGYRAFSAELQAAVAGHLQALASSDPQEQDQAVKEITKQVNERVEEAIRAELGIGNVFDDIDDVVGSDILALTALPGRGAPAPVSLGFGAEQGGRLLFYRDANQDGTGDVANPAVIGLGGWQNILRLFSGGNGILYAVDRRGRLLFYRDRTQDGTGDVANPTVIGQGGWNSFRHLFSAGNGILYAVDQAGRLLFYRDRTQDGTGDVANPTVIGQGGWQQFRFLFSGGNGILYAVDQAGRLLFYRDRTQDGTGDVANPTVIGQGGWQQLPAPLLRRQRDPLCGRPGRPAALLPRPHPGRHRRRRQPHRHRPGRLA